MSIRPVGLFVIAAWVLSSCCTAAHPCARWVPRAVMPQIAEAMRRAGNPPITFYDHLYHDPPGVYMVHTVGGYQYKVWLEHGRWRVKEWVVVVG